MLYGWMKSLIIYLILSGMVINLSPGNNYKRYISFFTGLIVIIILAEPLAYLFHISGGDIDRITGDMEGYLQQNSSLSTQDNMYDYYDMSLREALKGELAEMGYQVKEVEIITDEEGHILKCTIYCDKNVFLEDSLSENNLKNFVSDVYKVEMGSIYIVKR